MLGIVGDEVKIHESDGGNVFAFVAADKLYLMSTDGSVILSASRSPHVT